MPLLPENTEFGAKWCKLYESHIREGIREPIKVYEYLNRYFVQEGNKRVSVLKYLGAVAIEARVTRLIPKRDESNKQISIYYEFLDFDRRATFDNLWFSHRGGFTGLVNLVETWQHDHPDCDIPTADLINAAFKSFRLCYREAGFASVPITSGDAFLEYLKVYGFKPDRPLDTIREQVKSCEAQFKLVSVKDPDTVNTVEQKFPSEKASLSFFSRKPRKLKVAFAFESTPEKCLWTYDHDVARKRLERTMGDKIFRYHKISGAQRRKFLRRTEGAYGSGAGHSLCHQPQHVRGSPAAVHREPGQDHSELRFRPAQEEYHDLLRQILRGGVPLRRDGWLHDPNGAAGLHHHHGDPSRLHL